MVMTCIPAIVAAQESPSTPSVVPALAIESTSASKVSVTGYPDWLTTASGDAWVAVGEALTRLDGVTGAELATLSLPGFACLAMDVGFDAIWVGACGGESPSLVRVDPATTAVAAVIPLPVRDLQSESSVAAGEGAVWAVSDGFIEQTLVKVDPITGTVVGEFVLDGELAGVRAGLGGVWIARPSDDQVLHLDPTDGRVLAAIPVGSRPRLLAIGEGSVWVMNQGDGTVSRIDPASDAVMATVAVSEDDIIGGDIAVGHGMVWVRISEELVAGIDTATNEVAARFGPPSGSGGVAADDEAVWISSNVASAVWRLPIEALAVP
jgi:YVTN family beta-propeller protein